MKKCIAFMLVFLSVSISGWSQAAKGGAVHLKFGNTEPVMTNGKYVFPTLTGEQVTACQKIEVSDPAYKVASFDFSIAPIKGVYYGPFHVDGPALTPQIKEAVKSCAGSKGQIFIDNVKVELPDGQLTSFNYTAIKYAY